MTDVDRSSPMPLWAQIETDLRDRLASGAFDERFPTDEELRATYGVSRQTVREAVRHMQAEGLLDRRRGRGTTVSRRVLEQPLGASYSLALTIACQGLSEHSEVLAVQRREAQRWTRTELSLPGGEDVLFLERLRFADEEPLSLERSWMPWSSAKGLLDADLEHGSLYEALRAVCGVHVTSGSERIAPIIPPPNDGDLLRCEPHGAAFFVERRTFADSAPIELRHSTVRGDRYRFVTEWPARL